MKPTNYNIEPMPVRACGYYVLKLTFDSMPEVGYWTGRVWQRCGTQYSYGDDNFYSIGNKVNLN